MTPSNGWTPTLPPGFRYDPAGHRYTLGGRPLAGLTKMLEDCGYYPFSEWYTEKSRQRGTAAHKACELVDRHDPEARAIEDLRRVEVDPRLALYVSGYLAAKQTLEFKPIAHEVPICSAVYRIACTPDAIGWTRGRLAVIDLKTWAGSQFKVQRGAALQTAGQALMLEECGLAKYEEIDRYILQLSGNPGRPWKIFPCTNPRDRAMLLSLAAIWWDRQEHGLLKNFRPPVLQEEADPEAAEEDTEGTQAVWA